MIETQKKYIWLVKYNEKISRITAVKFNNKIAVDKTRTAFIWMELNENIEQGCNYKMISTVEIN